MEIGCVDKKGHIWEEKLNQTKDSSLGDSNVSNTLTLISQCTRCLLIDKKVVKLS